MTSHPKSHLGSLRPVAERSLVPQIALCPVHKKELGRYCEEDKVAFCIDCVPEHGGHAGATLEEKRAALDKIPSLRDSATALLSTIEGAVQTTHNRVKLLDKCTEETSAFINEKMDKVHSTPSMITMISNVSLHLQ